MNDDLLCYETMTSAWWDPEDTTLELQSRICIPLFNLPLITAVQAQTQSAVQAQTQSAVQAQTQSEVATVGNQQSDTFKRFIAMDDATLVRLICHDDALFLYLASHRAAHPR